MQIRWNEIQWGEDSYVSWFDLPAKPEHRALGYEMYQFGDGKRHHWLCLWFFNMGFSV